MPFIKLTQTFSYLNSSMDLQELDPRPIWVNTAHITLFSDGHLWLGKEGLSVKETSEEIIRLIKEAENGICQK